MDRAADDGGYRSSNSDGSAHHWLRHDAVAARHPIPAESTVSGLVFWDQDRNGILDGRGYPVNRNEEDIERSWGRVLRRARISGLDLDRVQRVAGDGEKGLIDYLGRVLTAASPGYAALLDLTRS